MTLSEKIVMLRNKHNMSQGDLAEKLNVSRQSVSKWETGASIPDLDKLIAMSELFQITLDELAKNIVDVKTEKEKIPYAQTKRNNTRENSTQKTVGYILLIAGLIFVALDLLTPIAVLLMVLGIYFVICGMICIFANKHAGRKILIMTIIIIAVFTFLFWMNMPVKMEIQQ